jgi:hypothetical protein
MIAAALFSIFPSAWDLVAYASGTSASPLGRWASAALYAMALGLTIISGEDGWMVRFLQLHDKVAGGKAALWCLCMMSVMTLLAFFAGRISVRWRQAEAVLREAA